MSNAQANALLQELNAIDDVYEQESQLLVQLAEDARDAEELETEADLFRYWRP
jgi:hypothetical protein